MDEEKIILTATEAESFCDYYCRFPRIYDEERHGLPLAESSICKNCPLTTAAERENKNTWTD
jgi:hypothetical protein